MFIYYRGGRYNDIGVSAFKITKYKKYFTSRS